MDDIRIGKLEENQYFVAYKGVAQALCTILSSDGKYYTYFNFQSDCNRTMFQKWYRYLSDYIFNEYSNIDGFTIFKNDLKPGMDLFLDEIGLERSNNGFYQANTLKNKQVNVANKL